MNLKKITIDHCPFCGGTEFTKGLQQYQGAITSSCRILKSQTLYHIICMDCGSVVRSYVAKPEDLAPKKSKNSES